jgi:hypothetical protein
MHNIFNLAYMTTALSAAEAKAMPQVRSRRHPRLRQLRRKS